MFVLNNAQPPSIRPLRIAQPPQGLPLNDRMRFGAVLKERFNGNPFDPIYHQGDTFTLDVESDAVPRYIYRVSGGDLDRLITARKRIMLKPLTNVPESDGFTAIQNFFLLLSTLKAKAKQHVD
jgi:hypothetical protein